MSIRYPFFSSTQILSEKACFSKSLQSKVGNDSKNHEAVRRKVCKRIRGKEGDRSAGKAHIYRRSEEQSLYTQSLVPT